MVSAKFLWGIVFFGGKLQIDAKNSNYDIFESALHMKSVSMSLSEVSVRIICRMSSRLVLIVDIINCFHKITLDDFSTYESQVCSILEQRFWSRQLPNFDLCKTDPHP